MEKIYIRKKDSVITGPYDVSQLQDRGLHASDNIWYEGLPEWMPAAQIHFLKQFISNQKTGFFSRILGVSK